MDLGHHLTWIRLSQTRSAAKACASVLATFLVGSLEITAQFFFREF
jgi:hypothetical protein